MADMGSRDERLTWMLASLVFSYYLANFANYNAT